jgi:glycosyltransferase involved in cell wall biosynthesis
MIVIIIPQLRSGGTEWQTLFLLKALKRFYDICLWIYVQNGADPETQAAFESLEIPIIYGSGWAATRQAAARQPQIILSYAINYYLPEILLKMLTGAVLITERRNQYHWLKTQRRRLMQETLRNILTRTVVCNSATVARRVAEMEYAVKSKLAVIPNSVNTFTPRPGGGPAIVAMSNIKAGKGLDIIARAFAGLRMRHVGDDIDFAIYGRLDEPAVWDNIPLEVVAQVYRGPGDRESVFSGALTLVHLSEAEGFPNAVLEAMSAGVVPIVSDIPVHRELFSDCALFADGQLQAEVAMEKLINLHASAPQEFAAMAQACRGVAARYSLDARSRAYRDLFDAHLH